MPQVRLFNLGRVTRPKKHKKHNKGKRRNVGHTVDMIPVSGTGGMTYVANRGSSHKKRRNPPRVVFAGAPGLVRANRAPRIVYRRRSNPMGSDYVEPAVYATVGGVLTRSIPAAVMSDASNSGFAGYLANAATAAVLGMAAAKFAGPEQGKWVIIGGIVMLIGRIASDYLGQNLVQFGQYNLPIPKLAGDPGFSFGQRRAPRMHGAFAAPYNFVIPFNSTPTDQRLSYPGPMAQLPAGPVAQTAAQTAPAAAPAGKGKGMGIWKGPWNN